MVRTELREHIFKMLFQIEFNDSVDMPENLNYYFETLEDAKEKDKQYIQNKYEAILSHIEEIDGLLNENATGWKTTRNAVTAIAVIFLRIQTIVSRRKRTAIMENTNMTKSPFNNVHALVFFIQKRISYTRNEMIAISKIFRREIRGSNVSQDEAFIISSVKIPTLYHPPLV